MRPSPPAFIAILAILVIIGVADAQPGPGKPGPAPTTSGPATATDGKLPEGVRVRLGTSKFREPNYIQAAGLSPDGKTIAIGNGNLVRFLEVATGKEDHRIVLNDYMQIPQIIWLPDGTKIVTGGQQGINVWDAKTGKLVKQVSHTDRNGNQGSISLSDDGKFAAVGHMYQQGPVRVIDLEDGGQVSSVQPLQTGGVFGALSPKGETLATYGQHYNRGNGKPEDEQKIARTIQLWDAKEGKEKSAARLRHLPGPVGPVLPGRGEGGGRRERRHRGVGRGERQARTAVRRPHRAGEPSALLAGRQGPVGRQRRRVRAVVGRDHGQAGRHLRGAGRGRRRAALPARRHARRLGEQRQRPRNLGSAVRQAADPAGRAHGPGQRPAVHRGQQGPDLLRPRRQNPPLGPDHRGRAGAVRDQGAAGPSGGRTFRGSPGRASSHRTAST